MKQSESRLFAWSPLAGAGVVLGNIAGKPLTDPDFAAVWAAIDANGIPRARAGGIRILSPLCQPRTRYSMETPVSLATVAHLSISAEMKAVYLSDDPPPGTYPDAA
jgi:hypothetical protein